MDEKEDIFNAQAEDFPEIDHPESDFNEKEYISTETGLTIEHLIDGIDPDEVPDFDWCEFNYEMIEIIESRVKNNLKKFMNKAGINDPYELSLSNPDYWAKLRYFSSIFSWWKFLDQIIQSAFPEFSFQKFGVNRIEMGNVIVNRLIIPIIDEESELDIRALEKEFNDRVLYKLYMKQRNND